MTTLNHKFSGNKGYGKLHILPRVLLWNIFSLILFILKENLPFSFFPGEAWILTEKKKIKGWGHSKCCSIWKTENWRTIYFASYCFFKVSFWEGDFHSWISLNGKEMVGTGFSFFHKEMEKNGKFYLKNGENREPYSKIYSWTYEKLRSWIQDTV